MAFFFYKVFFKQRMDTVNGLYQLHFLLLDHCIKLYGEHNIVIAANIKRQWNLDFFSVIMSDYDIIITAQRIAHALI